MKMTRFIAVALLSVLSIGHALAADDPQRDVLRFYDAGSNRLKSLRVYDTKGQSITIEYDCKKVASLKIEEKERQLRIYEDIRSLIVKLISGTGETICLDYGKESYALKYDRATVKVTALDKAGAEVAVKTLITGPKEHLSLGVDLPVTKSKTLKYDETSQSLRPQDSNPRLYLSANYLFGDVLEQPEHLKGLERLEIKVMLLASRRPLDSIGVGLGYKLGGIKLLGMIDLTGVSIFGGYFVTRVDSVADGAPQLNEGRKRSWQGGVSYDLGTGLPWVKF